MKRWLSIILIGLVLAGTSAIVVQAVTNSETEPNDSAAQANSLSLVGNMQGSISPAGDADYFSMPGINTTWGYIALLDTQGSSSSTDATLTALGSDGTTVLQSDSGSWENGSGIALQSYVDGSATHYLKVNETGDDATISDYSLTYYNTVVATQPEVEPNEDRSTGTPSAFTMSGTLSSGSDVDCYQFQGRQNDSLVLALKAGSASTADYAVSLIDPSNTILASANASGVGGNEFILYNGLASDGLYAYCVSLAGGSAGPDAGYDVGIVRNSRLYYPAYSNYATWENPGSGGIARVGDTLTFTLNFSNDSPVDIPGYINYTIYYDDTCLQYLSSDIAPTTNNPGFLEWYESVNGVAAGEVAAVSVDFQALKTCSDSINSNYTTEYFDTATAADVPYTIGNAIFLPLVVH